jgi:hypothetical protein
VGPVLLEPLCQPVRFVRRSHSWVAIRHTKCDRRNPADVTGKPESRERHAMIHDSHSRPALPGTVRAGANGQAAPPEDRWRWLELIVVLVAGSWICST